MIFGKRTLPGNSSGNRILFPKLNVLILVSSSKKNSDCNQFECISLQKCSGLIILLKSPKRIKENRKLRHVPNHILIGCTDLNFSQ